MADAVRRVSVIGTQDLRKIFPLLGAGRFYAGLLGARFVLGVSPWTSQ